MEGIGERAAHFRGVWVALKQLLADLHSLLDSPGKGVGLCQDVPDVRTLERRVAKRFQPTDRLGIDGPRRIAIPQFPVQRGQTVVGYGQLGARPRRRRGCRQSPHRKRSAEVSRLCRNGCSPGMVRSSLRVT